MNIHRCARTTPFSRALLVRRVIVEGWSVADAAAAAGVSTRSGHKWLRRSREDPRLEDRTSRPHRSPTAIRPELIERIEKHRRERLTCARLAELVGVSKSTVARTLRRLGLSRLKDLQPPEPVVRYEHPAPGDLLHLDTKKLARIDGVGKRITGDASSRSRGVGWEFVHVAIDDHSRVAYVEVLPDETDATCAAFLLRAVSWYWRLGIRVRRVLTDNGGGYVSKAFAALCAALRIRHLRTRPYRPQTNGKAERFIQTLLREWAYARSYESSAERNAHLRGWIRHYNRRRPHVSLSGNSPFSRIRSAA